MSDDEQASGKRDMSRIRSLSRGIQSQLFKAADYTETVAGLAEGMSEKLKPFLAAAVAQKIIATATSEPAKKVAIGSLYQLLPLPIRWAVKPTLFEKYARIHIFREGAEHLQIADLSNAPSGNDTDIDT